MIRASLLLLSLSVAACSNTPDVTAYLSPYRIDVRQGNLVTQDMVAQLKPGLTKEQVRFILGTPLVADIFHADRWDYIYRMHYGNGKPELSGKVEQRRLVVFFENGKLARVGGDVVGEDPDAAAAAPPKQTVRIVEIEAPKKAESKREEKKEEAKPAEPAPSN